MKKILLTVILAAILCVACACGNGDDVTGEVPGDTSPADTLSEGDITETTGTAETRPAPADVVYTVTFEGGITFAMGELAADTVASLGEWTYYAEAPSCIHPGMDKIYTFDGFDLTTSPDADGRDCIYEIAITSDAVALEGGLTIGSDRDAVESTFGTDYTEQFGVVRYELGAVSVSVILDGDYITSLVITVNW